MKAIVIIITFSFGVGRFPIIWQSARIVPVFKSVQIAGNYRSIPILCSLSKVIKRIAFNHIYAFLVKEGLLHKLQSGFRKLH